MKSDINKEKLINFVSCRTNDEESAANMMYDIHTDILRKWIAEYFEMEKGDDDIDSVMKWADECQKMQENVYNLYLEFEENELNKLTQNN